jgi:hypothetical protein
VADYDTDHMPSVDRLRALLFGRKIVRVEITDEAPERYESGPTGRLWLDDGTVLKTWGNDGGCACSAGCYPLTTLNTVDNAITNVEIEEHPDGDDVDSKCRTCGKDYCWEDGHDNQGYYRIFVIAEETEERRLLASFDGSDGNGYYGTGWWLTVDKDAASGRIVDEH